MPEEKDAPDLLDLKFLPAWVKETPNEDRYAHVTGEEEAGAGGRERRGPNRGGGERRGPRPSRGREARSGPRDRDRRPGRSHLPEAERREAPVAPMVSVEVRFVPVARVLEAVLAQIKSAHLAYSVFSLARMFLDKPERYDVQLKAPDESLFQLGENGPVAANRRVLENGAFLAAKDEFYRTEVTQSEPIKGNFTSVARCRLSGVLLGPTNHHAYQPQLRNLYEQRFSRRMSFPEYQRQIEIVTGAEAVERWKEEARSLTTYVTLKEEAPLTFNSAAEAERHFRQAYLPGLLRSSAELTLDGVVSRQLGDRSLGRTIEDAWAREFRSPSKMMQELMGAFRQAALHTFRHRKGMLFVSPVRIRPFQHGASSVSASVAAILAALNESPGIHRKQLLEKFPPESGEEKEEAREKRKRALASDLHWLISEGHVIEFNDGLLDLARSKAPPPPAQPNGTARKAESREENRESPPAEVPETQPGVTDAGSEAASEPPSVTVADSPVAPPPEPSVAKVVPDSSDR